MARSTTPMRRGTTERRDGRAAPHRVVIVGGGFGGLYAARRLGKVKGVDVTLIDRRNFHLFQPLLYQVATGALSEGEIAQPLRSILRHQANTSVILGEAVGIDVDRHCVLLSDGGPIVYDTLIVATGSRHAYFGHDEWESQAPGLKTLEDADEIRRRILIAFEAAEREADSARRREWMTFVVVGGGPTGVELAGALGEIANDTLRHDFRAIHPPDAHVILVEALDRILPTYPESLSRSAVKHLDRLGAEVRTGTKVTGLDEQGVTVEVAGATQRIPSRTILWAAGVRASRFGRLVGEATRVETDRAGRMPVEADLTVPGHPEIFVVGDLAVPGRPNTKGWPGVAPAAIQMGQYVGGAIDDRLQGRTPKPFRYRNKGNVATIGRARGVADLGNFRRFDGFFAWVLWLVVHIFYLIGFENRIVVIVRWAWSFFTGGRGSRLITGRPLLPQIAKPEPPA